MSASVHLTRPAPGSRRRSALRRFLETRGTLGAHEAPHVEVRLVAADATRLTATYLPGPGQDAPAVVLLHGFAAHRKKPAYAYLADELTRHAAVLAVDLRGHGDSGGASTLGAREALDVAAAVSWLRAYGHRDIVLVGLSMGGTSAAHALARGAEVAGCVLISTPGHLHASPTTDPMRRLDAIWRTPWKRHTMRALFGVRVVAPIGWTAPPHPVDAVAATPVPILVVHGEDDAYFAMTDAEDLVAAAGAGATLWREPAGFGHAEDGITADFAAALGHAIAAVVAAGRFPERRGPVAGGDR